MTRSCSESVPHLEFVVGSVRGLGSVDPENVRQAAGHQQPYIFIWVPEEELRGEVERKAEILLLLFFRVLIHIHVGLHHHLWSSRVKQKGQLGQINKKKTNSYITILSQEINISGN